jgi:uncharacterized protein YigE (DUF2233 family)
MIVMLLAGAALGCRRRAEPRAVPAPAGGAEVETDAGDTLVEDARRYAVRNWSFPLATHELGVEDVHMTQALDAVLERTGAELVVNGGFFGKDGAPVGLAVSEGVELAAFSRTLSGGVLTSDGERARLVATEAYTGGGAPRFAVQCRPRLVVGGAPNVRSDDGKRAERTALCVKDDGRTLDVFVVRAPDAKDEAGPSLYALGRWLAARGCEEALNLDGGPSTGAAWRDGGSVHLDRPRGPVRHAIVVKRR